ncbi:MAG TPA: hypothetical protein VFM14_10105 [Gemmatimonadales bacterium]|nr:hypothetical protein [Gemmatimonadales bacterium]
MPVHLGGKAIAGLVQAASDRGSSAVDVRGEQLPDGRVGLVQLECETPDGTAIKAVGLDQELAVFREEVKMRSMGSDTVSQIGASRMGYSPSR